MAPATVLVTGANRGIGLGIVKELLKNSGIKHIFAGARKPDEATDLKSLGDSRLHLIKLDVDCDESVRNAFKEVDSVVGDLGLNVLVNNAGIYIQYPIHEAPQRDILNKVFNTNVSSVAVVSQGEWIEQIVYNYNPVPGFFKNSRWKHANSCERSHERNATALRTALQRGRVAIFMPLLQRAAKRVDGDAMSFDRAANLVIASGIGSIADNKMGSGPMNCLAYRLSKTAVIQLARTLAIDFTSDHIFTAAYCPGWVQTDMGGPRAQITSEESSAELVSTWSKHTNEHSGGFFRRNGDVFPF